MEEKLFELEETDGIMVISMIGDFVMAAEKAINDLYYDLCERGVKKILFKFKSDIHITSGGMAILFGLIRDSQKSDQEIAITDISEHFKKTFHMVGITRYVTIYDSMEEAIRKMTE